MPRVKLDILSDPICPWCYIGKAKLDVALAAGPHPFEVEWHPFQLNPDMPEDGMNRRAYLEAKFGGPEGADRVYGQIQQHGDDMGLTMNLAEITRTPNTIDAHRVIHWAGLDGLQGPVIDALFSAYFVEGRDIGDRDTLADIADSAGLDAAVIRRALDTEEDAQMIRDRDAHARKSGVTAVPTFIIGNQHVVPGAQPPELWAKVIGELNGA
ncbi:MAG: DsbA family oxidoreductase [Shimia sp.]